MVGNSPSYRANRPQDINDLAISPQDSTILASCSADHSIRIWSLDPAHAQQPTAAICFGEGHKDQILSIVGEIPPANQLDLTFIGLSPQRPVHTLSRHGHKSEPGLYTINLPRWSRTLKVFSGKFQTIWINTWAPTSRLRCTIHTSLRQSCTPTLSTGESSLATLPLSAN